MRRSRIIWALAIVNALLLVGLSWKLGGENKAYAQGGGRGDYIMVPARLPGANSGVIYVINTREKLLVPVVFDNRGQNGTLTAGQAVNIQRIIENGAGVNGRR